MGRSSIVYVTNSIRWYLGKSLYTLRIRESAQLKIVLELCDMEIHQKISVPNDQKLKRQMVKRSIDQKLRLRNLWRQKWENWKRSCGKESKGILGVEGGKGICSQWKEKKASGRKETDAVSDTKPKIVHNNQNTLLPRLPSQPYHEVEVCRGREVSEAKVTMGPFFDNRADIIWDLPGGTCTRKSCEYWHPPECQFCKNETGCEAGDECLCPHCKVDEQPNKKPKQSFFPKKEEKAMTRMLWLLWKVYHNWVVYHKIQMHSFLKVESLGETRCRKSWNQFKGYDSLSLRYVKRVSGKRKDRQSFRNFARFYGRTQKSWDQFDKCDSQRLRSVMQASEKNRGPSLGTIQVKVPHQRSPHAMKFDDMSQEETNYLEAQRQGQSHLFLTYQRMVSPSAIGNKTRGKRIRCRFRSINAHVEQERPRLSRMGTARVSESPTTVVAANGEVQTKRRSDRVCQGIGFIRALTRKTLRRSRIFIQVHQWSETTTHQRWQTDKMQHGEPRTDRCSWFIARLFKLSNTYISDINNTAEKAVILTVHPASTRSESTGSTVPRTETATFARRPR